MSVVFGIPCIILDKRPLLQRGKTSRLLCLLSLPGQQCLLRERKKGGTKIPSNDLVVGGNVETNFSSFFGFF